MQAPTRSRPTAVRPPARRSIPQRHGSLRPTEAAWRPGGARLPTARAHRPHRRPALLPAHPARAGCPARRQQPPWAACGRATPGDARLALPASARTPAPGCPTRRRSNKLHRPGLPLGLAPAAARARRGPDAAHGARHDMQSGFRAHRLAARRAPQLPGLGRRSAQDPDRAARCATPRARNPGCAQDPTGCSRSSPPRPRLVPPLAPRW